MVLVAPGVSLFRRELASNAAKGAYMREAPHAAVSAPKAAMLDFFIKSCQR